MMLSSLQFVCLCLNRLFRHSTSSSVRRSTTESTNPEREHKMALFIFCFNKYLPHDFGSELTIRAQFYVSFYATEPQIYPIVNLSFDLNLDLDDNHIFGDNCDHFFLLQRSQQWRCVRALRGEEAIAVEWYGISRGSVMWKGLPLDGLRVMQGAS